MRTILKYMLLALLVSTVSCAGGSSVSNKFGSIKDRGYQLPVSAENYQEYEWNADSKKAYGMFLKIMNDHYFKNDYESCNLSFYDVLDVYRFDARVYVRLAESLARSRDYPRALDVLNEGGRRIPGLLTHPGVRSYMEELEMVGGSITEEEQTAPKGIIGKSISIITWPVRWPYNKIKGLF